MKRTSGRPLTRNEEFMGMVFGLWTIIGLFLDGWAHSHQKPDSFFTPWHAVLYSGFTSAAIWSSWAVWRRRESGQPLLSAAPPGHLLSLLGFAIFGLAAVGDLIWHQLLGVEVSVEALLSPTHLLLLGGGAIALSAPVRNALRASPTNVSWKEFLPALLSLTLLTALGAFFVSYLSPFSGTAVSFPTTKVHTHEVAPLSPDIAAQLREYWALGSILITTVVLVFPALFVRRRWKTTPGTFVFLYTFLLLLQTGLNEFEQWPLVAIGPVVGIVVDLSIRRGLPAPALGGLIPISAWSTYFLMFELQTGVGWSPAVWAGITILAGFLGALMGYLTVQGSEVDPNGSSEARSVRRDSLPRVPCDLEYHNSDRKPDERVDDRYS